jgi:hypothetical protein
MSIRSEMVTRIAAQVPEFQSVRGTVNIEAALRQGFPLPACFVYRLNTRRNKGLNVSYTTSFGVLIIVRIDRDDGSVDETADRLSRAVADALDSETWQPGDYRMMHTGGNADPDLKRNLLFWEDYYETQEFLN